MGKEKKETVWVLGSDVAWIRVKHSGLYDLEQLMSAAKQWLLAYKYDIIDDEHTEAVRGGGKDIVIKWKISRNVTDYIQYKFQLQVVVYRELDVVVEEDGKKTRKQQGDLEIQFKAGMAKNYRQTFRGAGKEFLRQTYEKYLMKSELEGYEKMVQREAEELLDTLKTVLGGFRR